MQYKLKNKNEMTDLKVAPDKQIDGMMKRIQSNLEGKLGAKLR